MYSNGDFAWIDFASTLPGFRGLGAQKFLIERRLFDGIKLGYRWFTVEAAEETENKIGLSYRNLLRKGFKVAYKRPNYLYVNS